MPKKFVGENSKATEARARKAAQKNAEKEKIEKEKEDAHWADDAKHVQRKQNRKEDRDRKQQEKLEKRQEKKALLEAEEKTLVGKDAPAGKVTQWNINENVQRQQQLQQEARIAAELEAKKIAVVPDSLPENINRLSVDGDEARNVDEAIAVLSGGGEAGVDKHPEKRMKAAYTAYEDKHMPRLKAENPNLRLSQLRQILKKEWQKDPENPMNQKLP